MQNISIYAVPGLRANNDPQKIIEIILQEFGISLSEISLKTRKRKIVYTRQAVQAALKQNTLLSLAEIGKITGLQDHSTVLYSIQQIENDKFVLQKTNFTPPRLRIFNQINTRFKDLATTSRIFMLKN